MHAGDSLPDPSFSVSFSHHLQVTIKAPNSEDSSYVNKKGFHSVSCQLVCDARGLLLSAETHWPGGLKDTEVLERSALYKQLQDTEEGWLLGETWTSGSDIILHSFNRSGKWILLCFLMSGDCRYPLRKWLMTPVDYPESPADFRYNLAHTATHEIVDRTFRAIQTRFKCLDGTKGYLQVPDYTPYLSVLFHSVRLNTCNLILQLSCTTLMHYIPFYPTLNHGSLTEKD